MLSNFTNMVLFLWSYTTVISFKYMYTLPAFFTVAICTQNYTISFQAIKSEQVAFLFGYKKLLPNPHGVFSGHPFHMKQLFL